MAYRVELLQSGHESARGGDTYVPSAGLTASWNLPYSCRVGMCRSSRAKLVFSGQNSVVKPYLLSHGMLECLSQLRTTFAVIPAPLSDRMSSGTPRMSMASAMVSSIPKLLLRRATGTD